jgi:hypothetical protein
MFNVKKVEKLNIDELYESRRAINERRVQLYNNVLKQVHNRIKVVGKTSTRKDILYKIPYVIFGESIYLYRDCIEHVVTHLTENGFIVEVEGSYIFVSWAHWVPSFIRNELKKKGTYVDSLGNILPPPATNQPPVAEVANEAMENKPSAKYKPISSYRPKRSVVYDEELLKQTEERLSYHK